MSARITNIQSIQKRSVNERKILLIVHASFLYISGSRACLKNHFRNLHAPLCGIFYPHSVAVARYAALIRIKSPTNWDSQLRLPV